MAASAGNLVGTIAGFKKSAEGKRMQREAQQKINDFEWQELSNPYENLQVSTAGSDMRREEAARVSATSANALRSGGTRGIVGGIGRVQGQNNLVNRDIAANLDEQQKSIDMAAAGQEVKNQDMIETRQANELAGYGQMMNVGMGMKYQGMGDVQATGQAQSQHNMELFETFGGAMGGGGGMSDPATKENIKKVGVSPKGINIYEFEYKSEYKDMFGHGRFQGAMSNEVPKESQIILGEFVGIDYDTIDVEFKKVG